MEATESCRKDVTKYSVSGTDTVQFTVIIKNQTLKIDGRRGVIGGRYNLPPSPSPYRWGYRMCTLPEMAKTFCCTCVLMDFEKRVHLVLKA